MTWKRKWIKLQARNDDMTLLNYQHICCFIISKRLLEYKLTLSYFWTLNDYFMIMAISVSLASLIYPFFIILTMEIKRHNYFLFTEKVIRAQRLVTHQFLLRCGQPNFNSPLSGIVRKIISFAYCFKFCGVSDLLPTSPITQKQNILMFCVMNFLFLCISFGLSEWASYP